MALTTVEGIYKDGKIELSKRPARAEAPVRVLVTFLPEGVDPPLPDTRQDVDREMLRRRAFARMEQRLQFGGPPYPKREDLHDRLG